MISNIIRDKINRIRQGGKARVLDLFAGCGGLSLGFQAAGFEICGAVEIDPDSATSHCVNFFGSAKDPLLAVHARARDIENTEPSVLAREFGFENKEQAFDVIIGGPPCQAFARIGRAKLREVAAHPAAFKKDSRAGLYLKYLSYVRELKPLGILIENVPDILNYGGRNVAEEICEVLSRMGYNCGYTLLNAAYYGVPQMRERMFLIAYSKLLEGGVEFPTATHWIELPSGYKGSRHVALKKIQHEGLTSSSFYLAPPRPTQNLPRAVTVEDAISDLPPIRDHLEGKLKRGIRRFNEKVFYRREHHEASNFAKLMRNWKHFESNGGVFDHVIRYLPRDYAIFRRMRPGDQYPQAYEHALEIFKEELEALAEDGANVDDQSEQYRIVKSRVVPPYDPDKFPNKWRKMESDKPARTLMAHLGKDSYSHIHYDSKQARTISVREAARLQSFPDGFWFAGAMNSAFRQIGNSVPPLLAKQIALKMAVRLGAR